jgi:uncharacterized protein YbbC (DUF1343 family)
VIRFCLFFCLAIQAFAGVSTGVDLFFEEGRFEPYRKKRIALLTNQTGVDRKLRSTIDLFLAHQMNLVALFCPEHGLEGSRYAAESVASGTKASLPVYSLHGQTRRPTQEMLQGIDLIVYDIQDVGTRGYTYATTLFYVMEEAAKRNIEVLVLDRPNPLGGLLVDGPLLEETFRSFLSYVNVPYCHGMTIGELARYFNAEYKVGCKLQIIAMRGWERRMTYRETGLAWIPPSPNIPEPDTPLYYPATGLAGELGLVNIGIGYTLPFKIIGAPWIRAEELASHLNRQRLPGVTFVPFSFKPFYGKYKGAPCEGVLIRITDPASYRPVTTQCMMIGLLKSLYPKPFQEEWEKARKELFHKAVGTDAYTQILKTEKYPAWKLANYQASEREGFIKKRAPYLLY